MSCAFGRPWRDHFDPPIGTGRGCRPCAAESRRLHRAFLAGVKARLYDRQGYTPADRRNSRLGRRPASGV